MSVDKFGKRGVDDKQDISLSFINNSYVRRDGSNTVIGSIDMSGNTLNNVGNPTAEWDVATKAYVDSNSAADKVSKSGDIITGDLQMQVSSDIRRLLGCTDLTEGKSFSLALGNYENQLHFSVKAASETQTPVTMETAHGFSVKASDVDVIKLGSAITVHKNIVMNDNRITHLPEPSSSQEPATKNYVDSRKPLITIWAEENEVLELGQFQWSFGSGSEGRGHRRSGYTMMAPGRIIRMGLSGSAGGAPVQYQSTVNVVVNGREKLDYGVTIPSQSHSATKIFSVPLELNKDDRINFRSGSGNPSITSAVVSLLIELDL